MAPNIAGANGSSSLCDHAAAKRRRRDARRGRQIRRRAPHCRQHFKSAAYMQLRRTTQAIESNQPAIDEVPTGESLAHQTFLQRSRAHNDPGPMR